MPNDSLSKLWRDEEFRRLHSIRSRKLLAKLKKNSSFAKKQASAARRTIGRARTFIKRATGHGPSQAQLYLYQCLLDLLGSARVKLEYPAGTRRFRADVFIIPEKVDLEVDGWHHKVLQRVKQADKVRDRWFKKNGCEVIRIPASIQRIDEFLNSSQFERIV